MDLQIGDDGRVQGRPARGAKQVGASRIVFGMLSALRELRVVDPSRNDIARFAEVTPALVTYYYPDRTELVLAAAVPVLEEYADRFSAVVDSIGSPAQKLRGMLALMTEYAERDAALLESYRKSYALRRKGRALPSNLLERIADQGKASIELWLSELSGCPYNADLIWNIMLGLANQPSGAALTPELCEARSALIIELLVSGVEGASKSASKC